MSAKVGSVGESHNPSLLQMTCCLCIRWAPMPSIMQTWTLKDNLELRGPEDLRRCIVQFRKSFGLFSQGML